jgi:SOS-response transcriptional repressor LexA
MASSGKDLTERQQEVLSYICRTWFKEKAHPTFRMVAHALGCTSSNPRALLAPLIAKGYITKEPVRRNNIRITDAGFRWYAENCPLVQPELEMPPVVDVPREEQVELVLSP